MASSASVQSMLSLPTYNTQGSKAYLLSSSSIRFSRDHQQKNNGIRCMADEKLPEQPAGTTTPPPPAAPKVVAPKAASPPPPAAAAPKVVKPKVSTNFRDVLGFSGPAPERINGRLAMVGFVAAIGAELAKGDDVVAQIANGGLPWFVGTSVVLSLASLVPLFKGVTVESKSKGFMTSDVEMLNGRFAMLGLVALVFTEFVTGSPLI